MHVSVFIETYFSLSRDIGGSSIMAFVVLSAMLPELLEIDNGAYREQSVVI